MLSQSAYIFAAKVTGYGIRILLPIFLVRVLTKADFGAYNQFFLLEVIFKMIFQMGVNQSQFFFVPRDLKNAGGYFVNSLLLNVVLFAAAYSVIGLTRGQLAGFLQMPLLEDYYPLLAAYSLLMMLNVSADTYLQARKRFVPSAAFEVSLDVLASAATLTAAYLTRDLRTIITALVASRLVCLLIVMGYVHFRLHGFRSERYLFGIRRQVRYGVVLGLAGMCWTFMMRMHELLVNRSYDIETYAVYAAGLKQIPVLQFFTQSVAAVALVRFAQLEKENDWAGIRAFWDRILGSVYGVGIPVTIFFIAVADPLVRIMFTSEYAGAIDIFRINTIAMLFYLLNPTLVLRAMDRNDVSLKVHLAVIAVLPFVLYAGLKGFGMMGIISAHALMLILGRVANHTVLNRLAPVRLPYVASRRSVLDFYGRSWQKGLEFMGRITGRGRTSA